MVGTKGNTPADKGRVGESCSLGPDRELIFFTLRCVMLKRQGNGQNQNK